ncbi:hypothetical protein Q0590_32040 [Rhodocytophaga aerolata]|uniref:Uncharacterized protein n=1 Tax=Rhodocytophaga aerolata TaxID=455078 RepID=A0ABT8RG41_9BACT|nr:hypothetical protein [Rhodocytophaga aerolata]MDO1450949.1 hypothetical protein [Rhodocytophaga aerolata]
MLQLDLRKELEATRAVSVLPTEVSTMDEAIEGLLEHANVDTYLMGQKRLEKRRHLLQTAYTEEQIRAICIKYRLRCLPVDMFKGRMDEQVPQKKSAFELNYTEAMQEEVQQEEYRLLAPSEMFRLTTVDRDPLLLYRYIFNGTYYYQLVHQWGGDLSKWRAVIHFPLRSAKHLVSCCLLFWLVIMLAMSANIGISILANVSVTAILLSSLTIFSASMFKSDDGSYQTSDKQWNSEFEW